MKTSEMIHDSIAFTLNDPQIENCVELIEALRPKFRRLEKAIEDEASGDNWAHLFNEDVKEE